jgi:hypothetical protein
MHPLYSTEFYEKHGERMVDGLSTGQSYVVLKRKSRSPVVLQFRPLVDRQSDDVVFVGGKLSSFFDPKKLENVEYLPEGAQAKLEKAFPKLDAFKRGERRVGTVIGFGLVAKDDQGKHALQGFQGAVLKMLNNIEKKLDIEIEDKRGARKAIEAIYVELFHKVFSDLAGDKPSKRKTSKTGLTTKTEDGMDVASKILDLTEKLNAKKLALK